MRCPACNRRVFELDDVCSHCGQTIDWKSKSLPDEWPNALVSCELREPITTLELCAFTHEKLADDLRRSEWYYLRNWQERLKGESYNTGFNLAAWFFSLNWLLYRKQYIPAIVYFIVVGAIAGFLKLLLRQYTSNQLADPLFIVFGIILSIPLGFIANRIYFNSAIRAIQKTRLRHASLEERLEDLHSRGGTSAIAVVIAVIIYIILFLLSIFSRSMTY